jgi:hypothetical protein
VFGFLGESLFLCITGLVKPRPKPDFSDASQIIVTKGNVNSNWDSVHYVCSFPPSRIDFKN